MKKDILTLGIESSCDETSVAIVKNGREVLCNIIDTQIPIHEKYGGVVPEIASRNHIEAISRVTKKALQEAKVSLEEIDAITPTYGPRTSGSLISRTFLCKSYSLCKRNSTSRSKPHPRTHSSKLSYISRVRTTISMYYDVRRKHANYPSKKLYRI